MTQTKENLDGRNEFGRTGSSRCAFHFITLTFKRNMQDVKDGNKFSWIDGTFHQIIFIILCYLKMIFHPELQS